MALSIPNWQPVAPLQPLQFPWASKCGVELAVLRLDLLDPLISGNKWFKLRPHLQLAAEQGAQGVLSLGGAHSNHLHSLAAAGQRFNFPTVGLLRGEPQDTPTVRDVQRFGMRLHWLGYGDYRARHQADFQAHWQARYPHLQFVPEGGGGLTGAGGFVPLISMLQSQLAALGWSDYDGCWLAVGTGTTLAGLVLAEAGQHRVHGALVVPRKFGVAQQISELLRQAGQADSGYCLWDACRGGYARSDSQLNDFMAESLSATGLPLEACYTAKALLALREQIEAGYFARGSRLVFVHTGGLQGRRAQLMAESPLDYRKEAECR